MLYRLRKPPFFSLLSILLLSFLAVGCDRDTGPQWNYVCYEGEDSQFECYPQLEDKEHLLTLIRAQEAWQLLVGHGELRHIGAALKVEPGSRQDPVHVAVDREDDACTFAHCRLELSDQALETMISAGEFSVTLTRVRIAKQSVRTVESTETFPTRGLKSAMRQAIR